VKTTYGDHSNCRQGRDCQVERDTPRAAMFAFILIIASIAGPMGYMLMGGPHA
jgi:hypothetical protein